MDPLSQPIATMATANGVPVHSGADAEHAAMHKWHPPLQSFDQSYLPEKKKLVARTDDVVRGSAMLQGGIRGQIDAVVGDHYRMSFEVDPDLLISMGLSSLQADKLIERVEEQFEVDWQSPENWFDASGRMNGSELCACGMYGHFRQGEVITIDKYQQSARDKGNRPFASSLTMINPDRVMSPYMRLKDPYLKAGFRQNKNGYAFGMYVLNRHPSETLFTYQKRETEFAYINRHGPTGRAKWQHIFIVEAADQSRGRSSITANIKKVRMLDKFEDTMLMNAINRAAYAAVVQSADPQTAMRGLTASGPDLRPDLTGATIEEREAIMASELRMREGYYEGDRNLELNGTMVAHTMPGDEFKLLSLDGNVEYLDAYETAFLRHLARGLNISYEELSGDYTKTNYSGARAGKTQSELGRRALAAAVPGKQATMMARNWMEEMFSTGRIQGIPGRTSRTRMNHFLNNKEALCQFRFYGPGVQHIDPVKGTKSAETEMKIGVGTIKDYVNTHGNTSVRKILRQRGLELRMAKAEGLDLHEMMGIVPKETAAQPAPERERNDV